MPALRYTQVNWNTTREFYDATTRGQGYLGGQLSDRRYKLYKNLSEEVANHYRKEAARYNNRYYSYYARNPLGLGIPTHWVDYSRGYGRSNYGQVMGSGPYNWDMDSFSVGDRLIGANGEVATFDLGVASNPRMYWQSYARPSPQDFAVAFNKAAGESLNRALAGVGNQDCYDILVSLMTDGQGGSLYELDDDQGNKPMEIVQKSLFDDTMNARNPIERVIQHMGAINRLTQLKFLRKFYQNNVYTDGAMLWDGDRKGLKVVLHGEKKPAYLDYSTALPMPSIHKNSPPGGSAENAQYYRDDFMYDLNAVSFWVGYYFANTDKVADRLEDSINALINEHWDSLKNIYNKELNLSNKTTKARIRKSALAKLAHITNLDDNMKQRIVAQAIQMDNPYTMLSVLGMTQQEAELIQLNFKDLSKLVGKKFCEEIRDNMAEGQEARVNQTQAQLDGEVEELNRLRKIKF